MLHESPNCMGIVHDPEEHVCGNGSVHKCLFAFDGWGKDDQLMKTRAWHAHEV